MENAAFPIDPEKIDQSGKLRIEDGIARCRLILSVVALLAVFIDPTQPLMSRWIPLEGGPFRIDPYALSVLAAHLLYSAVVYAGVMRRMLAPAVITGTIWSDVAFGAAIALTTEGVTSPFYPFFSFAVVVAGLRAGLRMALLVTAASVVTYLCMISVSEPSQLNVYIMRPAYLAIAGYLVGYLGQQRLELQEENRRLEAAEQRHRIARDLHDGFAQALAGINLQIAGCRRSLGNGGADAAGSELEELQRHVNREYDHLRTYMRSLAGVGPSPQSNGSASPTTFSVKADFRGSGELADHVLQIAREGIHNVSKHAHARSSQVEISSEDESVRVHIADDGVGFPPGTLPWSIASRVMELGGEMKVSGSQNDGRGASLSIALPRS